MRLVVTFTDSEGNTEEVYPDKISGKVNDNAATEITLTFSNRSGKNTDILMFNDIIDVQEVP